MLRFNSFIAWQLEFKVWLNSVEFELSYEFVPGRVGPGQSGQSQREYTTSGGCRKRGKIVALESRDQMLDH